jgi:hypothetical protein
VEELSLKCAACESDITELIEEWEARPPAKRGRRPTYCRDAECRRVRNAARQRKHQGSKARPRLRDQDALPPEIDFVEHDAWHATLADQRRSEIDPGEWLGGKSKYFFDEPVACCDCGAKLSDSMTAVKVIGTDRHRCQKCALAA